MTRSEESHQLFEMPAISRDADAVDPRAPQGFRERHLALFGPRCVPLSHRRARGIDEESLSGFVVFQFDETDVRQSAFARVVQSIVGTQPWPITN